MSTSEKRYRIAVNRSKTSIPPSDWVWFGDGDGQPASFLRDDAERTAKQYRAWQPRTDYRIIESDASGAFHLPGSDLPRVHLAGNVFAPGKYGFNTSSGTTVTLPEAAGIVGPSGIGSATGADACLSPADSLTAENWDLRRMLHHCSMTDAEIDAELAERRERREGSGVQGAQGVQDVLKAVAIVGPDGVGSATGANACLAEPQGEQHGVCQCEDRHAYGRIGVQEPSPPPPAATEADNLFSPHELRTDARLRIIIGAMSDRDLDVAVAKLIGWKPSGLCRDMLDQPFDEPMPQFSTDRNASDLVLAEIEKRGIESQFGVQLMAILYDMEPKGRDEMFTMFGEDIHTIAHATPRQICVAALLSAERAQPEKGAAT